MKAFYNGLRKVYGPQKRGTKQGVKQECVIAQHYFHCTLLLCSMLLLEMCMKEGIYIQPRSGADLFNVSHFKSKTCTTKRLVRKMPFFSDDSALVAHGASEMLLLVDRFARVAAQITGKLLAVF